MKNFLKKQGLAIQLTPIFIVVVIVSVALTMEAIDLPTSISIFAVLIAISILLISINEIRNRLRPWVAVARIEIETTENPDIFNNHFIITNTGPIPATRMQYTVRWYLQKNDAWEEVEVVLESPFMTAQQTLFPNQSMEHRAVMHVAGDKIMKVTFLIEYRGLWSKHTTTNTYRFDYVHKAYLESNRAWVPDEPQDYT